MPALSTPRMAAGFKVEPVPGMNEPTGANTPFRPARAFGAPHTTCSRSAPVSTTQTRSLSAFGCGRASITSATTKSRKAAPRSITASTSRPIIVSLSAISTAEASVSRWSFSQDSENFTGTAPSPSRWRGPLPLPVGEGSLRAAASEPSPAGEGASGRERVRAARARHHPATSDG